MRVTDIVIQMLACAHAQLFEWMSCVTFLKTRQLRLDSVTAYRDSCINTAMMFLRHKSSWKCKRITSFNFVLALALCWWKSTRHLHLLSHYSVISRFLIVSESYLLLVILKAHCHSLSISHFSLLPSLSCTAPPLSLPVRLFVCLWAMWLNLPALPLPSPASFNPC